MKTFLSAAMLAVVVLVACNQLGEYDPKAWPCGSPRLYQCPGVKTCCAVDEICRPGGWCADNAEIPTIRARQSVADAGDAQ